jgi:hypothetical protein
MTFSNSMSGLNFEEVMKAAAENVGNGKEPLKSSPETSLGRMRDRKHLGE